MLQGIPQGAAASLGTCSTLIYKRRPYMQRQAGLTEVIASSEKLFIAAATAGRSPGAVLRNAKAT